MKTEPLGGSRNNQAEGDMFHGSANHPSSRRPDPGSKQLPPMLFLEESTTAEVTQGHGEGKGQTGAFSETAQAGLPSQESSKLSDSVLAYSLHEENR